MIASLEFNQDCHACDKRRYRCVCDIDARHRGALRKVNAVPTAKTRVRAGNGVGFIFHNEDARREPRGFRLTNVRLA